MLLGVYKYFLQGGVNRARGDGWGGTAQLKVWFPALVLKFGLVSGLEDKVPNLVLHLTNLVRNIQFQHRRAQDPRNQNTRNLETRTLARTRKHNLNQLCKEEEEDGNNNSLSSFHSRFSLPSDHSTQPSCSSSTHPSYASSTTGSAPPTYDRVHQSCDSVLYPPSQQSFDSHRLTTESSYHSDDSMSDTEECLYENIDDVKYKPVEHPQGEGRPETQTLSPYEDSLLLITAALANLTFMESRWVKPNKSFTIFKIGSSIFVCCIILKID